MYKKIISLVLVVSMLMISTVTSFAIEPDRDGEFLTQQKSIYINEMKDISTENKFKEVNVSFDTNVNINGNLIINDTKYELQLNGLFYPFNEGVYNKNLVVGDFSSSSPDFKVLNVKVDTSVSEPTLIIVLMETLTGNYFELKSNITNKEFEMIYNQSETNLKEVSISKNDLDKKLLSLYKYDIEDNQPETLNIEYSSNTVRLMSAPRMSRSDLTAFLTAMNKYGEVKLSDYDIPTSLFTDTGWDHYHYTNEENNPFAYSVYASKNGSDEYLAQITMLDTTVHDEDENVSVQLEYYDGMVMSYNIYTKKAKVIYYGLGGNVSNIKLALYLKASNDNIFTSRCLNGSLKSQSSVKGLIGLLPHGGTVLTLWDYANDECITNAITQGKKDFPDTIQMQKDKYGDENIIKAIYGESGKAYMSRKDVHYFQLEGEVNNSSNNVDWSYKYQISKHL